MAQSLPALDISAPGKVILFGEHSVVYGKLAIAAAVSLRTKLSCRPLGPADEARSVHLDFADVGLNVTFSENEILALFDLVRREDTLSDGLPPAQLNEDVLGAVNTLLDSRSIKGLANTAASAFVYLLVMIQGAKGLNHTCTGHFRLTSELPIGAGLGSSASVSVVVAAAVLFCTYGRHFLNASNPISIRDEALGLIDRWAFAGEQVIHGNPSGVDNTVATYGGCVAFRKGGQPVTHTMPALPLLLTNTGVPRDTKSQVAKVALLKRRNLHETDKVLDEMDQIATLGEMALTAKEVSLRIIGDLMRHNQDLLRKLGVSHDSIEAIVQRHQEIGYTKLVGAGGGGCVVTLLKADTEELTSEQAKSKVPQGDEQSYSVTMGGPGVCVMNLETEECIQFT
ncbi:ribosomal protein S5 domain 2-type protein [Protomyces lactucae-debilis]|uniref:Mevalonate kinase n=1 Tax=Protomyces lactucae-debilis TaxID=2754530 RepID=A0A1Y2FUC6_PROLT|nr:ribosomal protein S5 domain 2-type protein [Protomyces lactucae-debilis]ORY86796.1 ribosomal protein S5 domain 2-type protein [Protomyces lactucae-debilis]